MRNIDRLSALDMLEIAKDISTEKDLNLPLKDVMRNTVEFIYHIIKSKMRVTFNASDNKIEIALPSIDKVTDIMCERISELAEKGAFDSKDKFNVRTMLL